MVRDRLLDDRAWRAAEQVFATGQAIDVDLLAAQASAPRPVGYLGARLGAAAVRRRRRRFAVVYADDQSEHARMEATRRDFRRQRQP